MVQHFVCRAFLDQFAKPQNGNAVGNFRHHAEVMRDEQDAGIVFALQVADQFQDLCLRGHVERRGRLVGDDEARFQDQRHGDHDTLALSARNLVRVGVIGGFRVRNFHFRQHVQHGGATFLATEFRVQAQHFIDLPADRLLRVERGHRLLKDHADAVAAQLLHVGFAERIEIGAFKPDYAIGHAHMRFRQKAHDCACRKRFAGAAFADEADDFTGVDGQCQVLQGVRAVGALWQRDLQVFDFENGCSGHYFFCLGLSASFRPSPSRLKERTVSRIAMPGMTEQNQSVRSTARP